MKVGEYVRTKKGSIAKVLGIDYYIEGNGEELSNIESIFFDNVIDDIDKDIHSGVFQDCLKEYKSSPNILELLEEHDFITIEYYSLRYDERVERIFEVDYKDNEFTTLKNAYCDFMLKNNEFNDNDKALEPIIKSIVTHEQFLQMEYRIGE